MDNNPIPSQETPAAPAPAPVPAPAQDAATQTPKEGETFEFTRTTILASLSYVGPLVVVPYLTEKGNPFVLFHIKQGLVLLVLYLALWVTGGFLYFLGPILQLVTFGVIVLSIIGIVYALQKKEKELPLVGSFAHQIKI